MKFQFTAIDSGGRVLRGVLRAENEEDARDLLLSEDVFAKQLEPVDEEEKTTWAPKKRIKERLANPNTWSKQGEGEKEKPISCVFNSRILSGFGAGASGQLGLSESGALVFQNSEGEALFQAAESEIELALVCGFPLRVLRVVLLNGKMLEFSAGRVFATSSAKSIAARFGGGKSKG